MKDTGDTEEGNSSSDSERESNDSSTEVCLQCTVILILSDHPLFNGFLELVSSSLS